MKVSVIVCTYSPGMMNHCLECINSLKNQSYDNLEIICIVDGNKEYYRKLKEVLDKDIRLHLNEKNIGLLISRNRGGKLANGDVIAFIDDDAVAHENWISELVKMYENYDAIAAGGKMEPLWLVKEPVWFPEEFYWLIGVTHAGFPDKICEVRNTFGSNLSFRRDVFLSLGGFNVEMGGIKGKRMLQGGETDLCIRMYRKFGKKVMYNPNAIVYHKIFKRRTKPGFLVRRSFWQGYSKVVMEKLGGQTGEESNFLKYLLFNSIPRRIKKMVTGKEMTSNFLKLLAISGLTASVGLGYFYGRFLKTHDRY